MIAILHSVISDPLVVGANLLSSSMLGTGLSVEWESISTIIECCYLNGKRLASPYINTFCSFSVFIIKIESKSCLDPISTQ